MNCSKSTGIRQNVVLNHDPAAPITILPDVNVNVNSHCRSGVGDSHEQVGVKLEHLQTRKVTQLLHRVFGARHGLNPPE